MRNLKISKLIREREMQSLEKLKEIETKLSMVSIKDESNVEDYEKDIETYHKIGELVITSGSIVACDPLCPSDIEPFIVQVPKGSFPVHITVVHSEKGEARIAEATINFSFRKVNEWRPALVKKQDLYYSGKEISDYAVDSGIGCFMDAEVAKILLSKMEDESYRHYVIAKLLKTPIHNCNQANIELNPETSGNVIAFSTGFGDGFYDSQAGYDKSGKIVCIVTDFVSDLLMGN